MYPLNTVSHCAIVSESTTRSSNDTCIRSLAVFRICSN